MISEHADFVKLISPRGAAGAIRLIEAYLEKDQLQDYLPYPKQAAFHAAGANYKNRMVSAGNQQGKTYSSSAEIAMHLTGEYPPWWKGLRFDRPVVAWASGETGERRGL